MNYTVEQVEGIVVEAKLASNKAAVKFFQEKLGGRDQFACGFAWVNIHNVKGNTKLGKALKAAGVEQNYNKVFSIWNPSELHVQNIDCKEEGARAAAEVFTKYGFTAYADSRLD